MRQIGRKLYKKLSYSGKFKLIFYSVFIAIALAFIVLGLMASQMLSDEVYERNQEKLSVLTYNVQAQMEQIQTLTTELNQNETFQLNLEKKNNEELSGGELHGLRNALQVELNWLLVNKQNIKRVLIFDDSLANVSGNIISGESTFQDFSIYNTIKALPADDTIGEWFLDENVQEAIYVRNLFSTRHSVNERIGVMVAYLNLNFVDDLLADASLFSSDDYLTLAYQEQISSTNYELFKKHKKDRQLIDPKMKGLRNSVESLGGEKYFVQKKMFQVGSNQFTVGYYMENRQLLAQVFQIITVYFIIMAIILLLGFKIVEGLIARLVSPINKLASTMQKFEGEESFKSLSEDLDMDLRDEVGVLNHSFKKMIDEIQELVIKEYHSELLTKEMEYRFLQAQLDPHFLYNTLNSINWLAIDHEEDEISEMVSSLAVLLQSKFDQKKQYHSIQEELDIVQAYLNIQFIRFKERLRFSQEVDRQLLSSQVPKLILQPLIENAIKYGLEQQDEPVNIHLVIKNEQSGIRIDVSDNGAGFENSLKNKKKSTGVGLENIRERITIIYGELATLEIDSQPYILTRVSIYLPNTEISEGKKEN
ncbi:hypothetical protein BAU15_02890 [Enterococcus sp. JM4C]|uniref:sensor histidine kinase n=1 Tax=Candidatus Enterococcus huntleyi TaxID=1857217 RepID=UPI001379B9F7|nr:histidine kinase [Enterococcus sp. JM4C]KAF1299607.1 hypothetical protein BAU15_02890 [Enterococcus sp. JM4C]